MEQANLLQAMKERHSVRSYLEKPIDPQSVQLLRAFIDSCNRESGLHMQLVLNEPNAFSGLMAHYGKFSGVQNYIAVVGKKGSELEEKSGYFGEKVVLYAQSLGLNTCWVAMTYSKIKTAFQIDAGEKLCLVISIGYGQSQGVPHQSKPRGERHEDGVQSAGVVSSGNRRRPAGTHRDEAAEIYLLPAGQHGQRQGRHRLLQQD